MSADGMLNGMLVEARAEVALADTKASILLAALGLGFSALFGGLIAGDWDPSVLHGSRSIFWWTGALFAIGSVAVSAAAIWPRYSNSPGLHDEIYYWGHVAQYDTLAEFTDAVKDSDLTPAMRTRHQLWHLSRLVARKYLLVRIALILSGIAGVTLFLVGVANL